MRFPEFSGEWESCKLRSIGYAYNGLSGKSGSDFGTGAPFITYKSVFDNSKIDIRRTGLVKITEQERLKHSQNTVRRGDAFFTISSETSEEVGMSSVLLDDIDDCYLNSFCFGYRPTSTSVTSGYLRHYLRSPRIRKKIIILAQGSTRFNISKDEVLNLTVALPSLDEQNKIARTLDLIEERIKTQSKIIEELKTLRSALVDTYIKDANSKKSNQTIISLGNYGSFVRGLTYSSADITDDTSKTGVVRSNNLEYGSPVDTTSNLVYVNKNPVLEQRLVKGDIVICMANGSSSLVGKASYYQGSYDNMTVGAFCGIYRGNHPLAKWIFMSSAYCKAVANAIQGGNGAIANLHGEDILSMNFVVPSDQNRTTALYQLLNLYDSKIQIAEEELFGFIEQKQFFLCKMFI